MSGCYFCGHKFTSDSKRSPVHIKSYDIDICSKCAKMNKERWKKMVNNIKGSHQPELEPMPY